MILTSRNVCRCNNGAPKLLYALIIAIQSHDGTEYWTCLFVFHNRMLCCIALFVCMALPPYKKLSRLSNMAAGKFPNAKLPMVVVQGSNLGPCRSTNVEAWWKHFHVCRGDSLLIKFPAKRRSCCCVAEHW